jgi:hypothetical protein
MLLLAVGIFLDGVSTVINLLDALSSLLTT